MDIKKLCSMIDHTNLKPEATEADIKKLCEEAAEYNFGTVCVSPCFVEPAAYYLEQLNCFDRYSCGNKKVNIVSVISFPLGNNLFTAKLYEATDSIFNGALELDIVANIGQIKSNEYYDIISDLAKLIKEVNKDYDRYVTYKLIIETCLLSNEEIINICSELIKHNNKIPELRFVKTSTGFSKAGATVENVKLIKEVVGDKLGIKASGGIKTWKQCKELIDAGATRIGTSNSVQIFK